MASPSLRKLRLVASHAPKGGSSIQAAAVGTRSKAAAGSNTASATQSRVHVLEDEEDAREDHVIFSMLRAEYRAWRFANSVRANSHGYTCAGGVSGQGGCAVGDGLSWASHAVPRLSPPHSSLARFLCFDGAASSAAALPHAVDKQGGKRAANCGAALVNGSAHARVHSIATSLAAAASSASAASATSAVTPHNKLLRMQKSPSGEAVAHGPKPPLLKPAEQPAPPPPPLPSRSRIARDFSALRVVGSGGFGVVVAAKSKHDCATYAVKLVPFKESERHAALAEVAAMAAIPPHPQLVRYHGCWVEKPSGAWATLLHRATDAISEGEESDDDGDDGDGVRDGDSDDNGDGDGDGASSNGSDGYDSGSDYGSETSETSSASVDSLNSESRSLSFACSSASASSASAACFRSAARRARRGRANRTPAQRSERMMMTTDRSPHSPGSATSSRSLSRTSRSRSPRPPRRTLRRAPRRAPRCALAVQMELCVMPTLHALLQIEADALSHTDAAAPLPQSLPQSLAPPLSPSLSTPLSSQLSSPPADAMGLPGPLARASASAIAFPLPFTPHPQSAPPSPPSASPCDCSTCVSAPSPLHSASCAVSDATRWRWVAGIAAALHAMHEAGFVHNDLKPLNIFCCPATGAVKVADFGCCAKVGSAAVCAGTALYAAPERRALHTAPTIRAQRSGVRTASLLVPKADTPSCAHAARAPSSAADQTPTPGADSHKAEVTVATGAPTKGTQVQDAPTADGAARVAAPVAHPASDMYSLGVVVAEMWGRFRTAMERAKVVSFLANTSDKQDDAQDGEQEDELSAKHSEKPSSLQKSTQGGVIHTTESVPSSFTNDIRTKDAPYHVDCSAVGDGVGPTSELSGRERSIMQGGLLLRSVAAQRLSRRLLLRDPHARPSSLAVQQLAASMLGSSIAAASGLSPDAAAP